jgi:uncharacterized repeat protein (TIGR03803 family)
MQTKKLSAASTAVLAIFAVTLLITGSRAAAQEVVLRNFSNSGAGGYDPYAGVISDAAGNLYGTTRQGGTYGYGTVFELSPKVGGGWIETVLHTFNNNGRDGVNPCSALVFDAVGNLYGTTNLGGTYFDGTVFELSPTTGGGWTEKILHSFKGDDIDGAFPEAGLVLDAAGRLYGATTGGGTPNGGTVFELTLTPAHKWTEKILHEFGNGNGDGTYPYASLAFDAAGNLYGTTVAGGASSDGTVFELTPGAAGVWTETLIHTFNRDGTDGVVPYYRVIFDASGNLYGTTSGGGADKAGTVFELTPTGSGTWTETILYTFNEKDGNEPSSNLIFDASGNLYGTTEKGGSTNSGTVFELTPAAGGGWTETVLHSFGYAKDGQYPQGGLIFDTAHSLYGTTLDGGANASSGTVFEITP